MSKGDSSDASSDYSDKKVVEVAFSDEEAAALEKRVWRKVDLVVVPFVTMFYLLSWLDRTNLGNARIAGLQKELKLTNDQYSMALTVTFIPYALCEIPSNLLLKVIGPNYVLPALVTLWGLTTTLQGLVTSYHGLIVARFFIGLFEGGVLPGLVLYLSFFYPRRKLQSRISAFFSSASLSGAFSGLLATAILKMNGREGRGAWAWIFILEGAFTVAFGLFSFFFFPRSPAHASFLSEREKEYIHEVLKKDGAISSNERADGFSWKEIGRTFTCPHFWFLGVVYFCQGTIVYSLSYFAPSIVNALGYSPVKTQLMTVGPYASAFVVTNVTSILADRYQCRGLVSIFSAILCIAGFAIYKESHRRVTLYGSLFLTIGGISCSSASLGAWVANNFSPYIRRATAIAGLSMITNLAGILATWLWGSISTPPRYTVATNASLALSVIFAVFMMANLAYLYWANQSKAKSRESIAEADEDETLGDKSAYYKYIL
ncbi:major facilitator superfamily domain-containing protein [Crepidotus variabilis]|uniref:Major facilitator superfamily domain-containing protein n=1 Tax=Crepidotus variabilis TaxID=179855 RepID=A0A9P6JQW7_9AGAR|nr:major facilitator superfamily domain-containing protein [Crepidotus variabilis]